MGYGGGARITIHRYLRLRSCHIYRTSSLTRIICVYTALTLLPLDYQRSDYRRSTVSVAFCVSRNTDMVNTNYTAYIQYALTTLTRRVHSRNTNNTILSYVLPDYCSYLGSRVS